MAEFLQQLINGLSLGAIYALIALGYTMVYGVLRFINFAHGDVFMVGAFAGYYLGRMETWQMFGHRIIPAWLVIPTGYVWSGVLILLLAMLFCGTLGVVIELLAYRPLRQRPKLTVLITAIGVSLLLEYVGQHEKVFGASPKTFPQLFPSKQLELSDSLSVGSDQVLVLGVAAALLVVLQFIVKRTRLGTAMRAVSFNADAASLMGININFIISFTFGLGSALAAAGGILYAMNYQSIDPLMGIMPGLKAFIAAVLGGIGNIPGAAIGGILLGVVETFVAGSQWSNYRDAIAFAILIAILLFKPSGLLGKREVEKV